MPRHANLTECSIVAAAVTRGGPLFPSGLSPGNLRSRPPIGGAESELPGPAYEVCVLISFVCFCQLCVFGRRVALCHSHVRLMEVAQRTTQRSTLELTEAHSEYCQDTKAHSTQ